MCASYCLNVTLRSLRQLAEVSQLLFLPVILFPLYFIVYTWYWIVFMRCKSIHVTPCLKTTHPSLLWIESSPKSLLNLIPNCLYVNFISLIMFPTPTPLSFSSNRWFPAVHKHAMLLYVSVPLSVSSLLFPVPFPPCSLRILNPPFKDPAQTPPAL